MDGLKVCFLVDDWNGCAWYRCHVPAHAAQDKGYSVMLVDSMSQDRLDWCDVLIVQRLYQSDVLKTVRWANARGKVTIYDIDDDLWSLHPCNPSAPFWTHEHLGMAVDIMRECKVVTTTTPALAKTVEALLCPG